jgi:hypothetical protein
MQSPTLFLGRPVGPELALVGQHCQSLRDYDSAAWVAKVLCPAMCMDVQLLSLTAAVCQGST